MPKASTKRPPAPAPRHRSRVGWIVAALFLLGLVARVGAMAGVHDEGDEIVYRALVQKMDQGGGYNLQGASFLGRMFPEEQYGNALFYHPPGGVALFWLLQRVLGENGWPVAQLIAYAVFFFAMLALGRAVLPTWSDGARVVIAALASFSPIMAHVVSRYWLDGPALAFGALAGALFLAGVRDRRMGLVVAGGIVLGYASLVKTTALVVAPGLALTAWALRPDDRAWLVRATLVFGVLAAAIQAPWELWQWQVLGSPFPYVNGRPVDRLVSNNPYVHYVTVERSPWIYVTLLPIVLWSLVPSLALFATARLDARARRIGWALVGWILVIVLLHVRLGAIGYSKVLRYVVLVTPATILLAALTLPAAWAELRGGATGARKLALAPLVVLGVAGIVLEMVQGAVTALLDQADLIHSLLR